MPHSGLLSLVAAQRSVHCGKVKHPLKACLRLRLNHSAEPFEKGHHANGQPQGGYIHQPPERHISLHRNSIGFLCTLTYSVIHSLDDSCHDCTDLHSHRLSSPPCCQSHIWGNCWHLARLNPFSSHDVDPRSFLNYFFHYFALANIFSIIRCSIYYGRYI